MNALVGYTGFVGSNLSETGNFDLLYNSKNIEDAYGTNPSILVYAGIRAEKYLANLDPNLDYKQIEIAKNNIKKINPQKIVLISTVDVFNNPIGVDEDSPINTNGLQMYGYNRFLMECWVREEYPDALIIRLPALYGKNIKKNFIYDYINIVPYMLKEKKFFELIDRDSSLDNYYTKLDNGFYKVVDKYKNDNMVKNIFKNIGFSALNFTDSRSRYQFYNLRNLWNDINRALELDIRLLNLATAPIYVNELYKYLTGEIYENYLDSPADYDFRTKYDRLFGGGNGYIYDREHVLFDIKRFIEEQSK